MVNINIIQLKGEIYENNKIYIYIYTYIYIYNLSKVDYIEYNMHKDYIEYIIQETNNILWLIAIGSLRQKPRLRNLIASPVEHSSLRPLVPPHHICIRHAMQRVKRHRVQ